MTTPTLTTASTTFVRAKQAAQWLNVSKSTFHQWVRDGRIPAGFKLSPGVTVWDRNQVALALGLEAR